MRRRISRALFATAAAGATITTLGFAAIGSASAATGAPAAAASHRLPSTLGGDIYTPACADASGFHGLGGTVANPLHSGGCAGYVGSGRDFRYAQAVIKLPAAALFSFTSAPAMYIGLSSGDTAAVAGIVTCNEYKLLVTTSTCTANTWLATALLLHQGTAVPLMARAVKLPPAINPGEGIKFAIYYNQTGNALHYTIDQTPAGGPVSNFSVNARGAVFTHAVALADFSLAVPAVPGPTMFPSKLITRFNQGGWTTAGGVRGTFLGPWTTQPVSVTSPNGFPPPGNQVTVEPAYLWNDGLGNGPGDAFGVWWRT